MKMTTCVDRAKPRIPAFFRMKRNLVACIAAAVMAGVMLVSPASGAVISIGAVPLSANGAEILNTGSLVSAWDVNGGSNATVNGITFTTAQPSSITLTGFSYSVTSQPTTVAVYGAGTEMAKLMEGLKGSGVNAAATVTINNLIVGDEYRVQFISHEAEAATNTRGMWVQFGATASTTPVIQATSGYISTIVFTATSNSQNFVFHTTTNRRSVLNAMSVFNVSVPTPAAFSSGLVLLAGCGVARRFRRRG